MPKNTRWIICWDFETDGKDPETCSPVQLAAVPIDPMTLNIKKDDIFNVIIKPDNFGSENYFDKDRDDTIDWHAKNHSIAREEIIDRWSKGISTKIAIKTFSDYCKKYEVKKRQGQWYPQPIPAGYNIIGYDIPILDRLCKQYDIKYPMSTFNKLDLADNMFWWFENLEEPADIKMDTLREFFGMKANGISHDAVVDVLDTAELLVRFMQFHRKQASVDKFKGAFA